MKSKLLPILLFLLLILNGVLIFMLVKKPHERVENRAGRNFLTSQLEFTESQTKDFIALERRHRNTMMKIDENIKRTKDILFNSFSKDDFKLDSIANEIGFLQTKKEIEVFTFFSKVRKLCTKEQMIKFDKIIKEALHGGDRRPPRDGRMPPPQNGNRQPPR